MKIEVIHHASIRIEDEKIIYFDPFDIKEERHDADYIFITHDHYDHYEESSIEKVKNANTKIIVPECLRDKNHYMVVEPNKEYMVDNLLFQTIPSYNTDAKFHLKEMNYVGYNLLLKGVYYYIMGDTNRTPEANHVKTNICFVPIGGTYTMDVEEASNYINDLKPKVAIPIHYGKIIGDISLGEDFKRRINQDTKVMLMIKENEK